MYNLSKSVLGLLCAVLVLLLPGLSFAQFAGKRTDVGITCPVSGSSIQVLAANGNRTAFVITNDSNISMRIGALNSGTGALDDTNSIILTAFSSQNDGGGQIYLGRIVCMSTTAATAVIHVTENSIF